MRSRPAALRLVRGLAAALAALFVTSVVLVVSRSHDDRSGPHSSEATAVAPRRPGAFAGGPTVTTAAAGNAPPASGSATGGAPKDIVRRATPASIPPPGPTPSSLTTTPTTPITATMPTTSAPDPSGKRWVRVGSLAGRTNGASAPFHLAGVDTRLVYKSESGSFAVFLVDERQGREATAGYADLDCAEPCTGEVVLVDPPGTYHLEVETPGGDYEIAIEEYRRPGR